MTLIACGPWLEYSKVKRTQLFLRYWPFWVFRACWKSKRLWFRYMLYKIFGRKPIVYADLLDLSRASEEAIEIEKRSIVSPMTFFYLFLSGRGNWLWYESQEQLEKKGYTLTYHVDWEGEGIGWYPFW